MRSSPCDSALGRAALPRPASGCRLVGCLPRGAVRVWRLPLLVVVAPVWTRAVRAGMIGADSWSTPYSHYVVVAAAKSESENLIGTVTAQ